MRTEQQGVAVSGQHDNQIFESRDSSQKSSGVYFTNYMENKSIEELEQERVILKLRLLRLNKKIAKRKAEERSELKLKDRSGIRICVGDKVRLLTRSSKSSPFSGISEAIVLGTAHNGK